MAKTNPGTCLICDEPVTKRTAVTHILKHLPVSKPSKTVWWLIKAEGTYLSEYWLMIAASPDDTLEDLDELLKNTWLECCGHMSEFTISGQGYSSSPDLNFDGEKLESMKVKLKKVLDIGSEFSYIYDYGTSTELTLTVMKEINNPDSEEIEIVARNDPPEILCGECGKPADFINCESERGDSDWALCENCTEEYDEEMLLCVTNSPRCGQCGYEG